MCVCACVYHDILQYRNFEFFSLIFFTRKERNKYLLFINLNRIDFNRYADIQSVVAGFVQTRTAARNLLERATGEIQRVRTPRDHFTEMIFSMEDL